MNGRFATLLPDPSISANIYASGLLDEVMLRVLVPLREEILGADGRSESPSALLWAMRYARNGEHLKIRLHVTAERVDTVRSELETLSQGFLGELEAPAEERHVQPNSPPIDGADFGSEMPPDRTLEFTEFRPSKVSFGGEPYLEDLEYRGLMVQAFDASCTQVLADLAKHDAAFDHSRRQRLMLGAVLQALASLGLSAADFASYVAYHRDWLIRAPLLQAGADEERAQDYLKDLERLAERSSGIIDVLRETIGGGEPQAPNPNTPWGTILTQISQHVDGRYDDSGIRLDPFAAQSYFPALIKVLHGFANLLGLKRIDEAFALHLMLCSAVQDQEPYRRIDLTPP